MTDGILGSFGFKRAEADLNTPVGDTMAFRLNAAVEDSGSYRDQQCRHLCDNTSIG